MHNFLLRFVCEVVNIEVRVCRYVQQTQMPTQTYQLSTIVFPNNTYAYIRIYTITLQYTCIPKCIDKCLSLKHSKNKSLCCMMK